MGQKCSIFSVGTSTAFGAGNDELVQGLLSDSSSEDEITDFEVHEDSPGVGCMLKDLSISKFFPSIKSYIDKCTALTLKAAFEAIDPDVFRTEVTEKVGLIFASQYACISTMSLYGNMGLDKGWRFAPPFLFIHSYPNTPAATAHIELGLKGFSNVFSGSQQSGELAVIDAISVICSGKSDAILAGGVDVLSQARYNELFLSGSLGDFDNPKEINTPGEAGAFLLLGNEESDTANAASRNNNPIGTIEVVSSLEYREHDFYFLQNPDEKPIFETEKMIDIGKSFGRCAAATLPLSICAFLLHSEISEGSRGIFPVNSISGHYLYVEKRK